MVYGRTDGERALPRNTFLVKITIPTWKRQDSWCAYVRTTAKPNGGAGNKYVHRPQSTTFFLDGPAPRSMDASPLFDPQYLPIIVGTLVGFAALAALLLVPIYRFLDREEEVAEDWTPEALAERMRERQQTAANGTEAAEEREHSSEPDGSPSASP